MPNYLTMAGFVFAAAGVALGFMSVGSPGIGYAAPATLLVGSALTFGLGGVIRALESLRAAMQQAAPSAEALPEKPAAPEKVIMRREATKAPAPVEEAPAPPPAPAVKPEPPPVPPPAPPTAPEPEPPAAEPKLYVVEERIIRNCAARELSDGTIEAETEEGWMRFENEEHLNEYLDAMAPIKRL